MRIDLLTEQWAPEAAYRRGDLLDKCVQLMKA
jgi:hypothetical protein